MGTVHTGPARLFSALVLGGAALAGACGHGSTTTSDAPSDDASRDSVSEPTSTTATTAPTPTSEVVAAADACECADRGTLECSGNGVTCCWALDPCCEPCC